MAKTGTATTSVSELRSLPAVELTQQIAQRRTELAGLRRKARQGALEQPHRIRLLRREIARLLTLVREAERPTI